RHDTSCKPAKIGAHQGDRPALVVEVVMSADSTRGRRANFDLATGRTPGRRNAPSPGESGSGLAREADQAVDGLCALFELRDERDTHVALAGVDPVRLTAEVTARQHGDRLFGIKTARELRVIVRRARPEVERGVRLPGREYVGDERRKPGKFLAI